MAFPHLDIQGPLVRLLPRKLISRMTGAVARTHLPRPVLTPLLRLYAHAFGADLDEMREPLVRFRSFTEFFTRLLRPGLRPFPSDPNGIGSPSDGRVHSAGSVDRGTLLQVKGVTYAIADLLGDRAAARDFTDGTYVSIHLAPGDYHRFHWPFSARVESIRHLPGDLWPVHARAMAARPNLLARNERVALTGALPGSGRFAVVAVGALNVGSIRLTDHSLRTNRGAPARPAVFALHGGQSVERGGEMGWFELGSTLVVLLSRAGGTLDALAPGTQLRVGRPVGRLVRPSE